MFVLSLDPAVHIVPIRERATGLRLILKLNWLRWFFVGFMLSYNAKLCQAYFAQNRQFLAIEIFERRTLSKRLCMVIFTLYYKNVGAIYEHFMFDKIIFYKISI